MQQIAQKLDNDRSPMPLSWHPFLRVQGLRRSPLNISTLQQPIDPIAALDRSKSQKITFQNQNSNQDFYLDSDQYLGQNLNQTLGQTLNQNLGQTLNQNLDQSLEQSTSEKLNPEKSNPEKSNPENSRLENSRLENPIAHRSAHHSTAKPFTPPLS
ncbi:hypothetical protein, partial [Prochlorothrix hollandica]|uniref:hypothetical protein n=1 Tax=Prochlorothrix hollandica TaxID=1223 RepID=UPI003341A1F6